MSCASERHVIGRRTARSRPGKRHRSGQSPFETGRHKLRAKLRRTPSVRPLPLQTLRLLLTVPRCCFMTQNRVIYLSCIVRTYRSSRNTVHRIFWAQVKRTNSRAETAVESSAALTLRHHTHRCRYGRFQCIARIIVNCFSVSRICHLIHTACQAATVLTTAVHISRSSVESIHKRNLTATLSAAFLRLYTTATTVALSLPQILVRCILRLLVK